MALVMIKPVHNNNKLFWWRYGSNQIENATPLGPAMNVYFGKLFLLVAHLKCGALQMPASDNKHYR